MAGPSVPSRDLVLVAVPAHGASVLRWPPWLTGGAWRKAAGATSPWRRGVQLLSVFRQHRLNNISRANSRHKWRRMPRPRSGSAAKNTVAGWQCLLWAREGGTTDVCHLRAGF